MMSLKDFFLFDKIYMKENKPNMSMSVKLLIKAGEKQGVKISPLDEKAKLSVYSRNGTDIFVKGHIPDLNSTLATIVSSNKSLCKRVLKKHNIKVPRGTEVSSVKEALEVLKTEKNKFPVVVKPALGSGGKAVTAGVKKRKWFVRAIKEVLKYNRQERGENKEILIEDYIHGDDHRIIVLDGKVLTVMRREPAYVIGDNTKTIKQLICDYNNQPGVGKVMPLCPIVCDYELDRNLELKKLTLKSIPAKRKKIYLRQNANVSTGGRSFECHKLANDYYSQIALKAARVLHLRYCGVDLITKDISKIGHYAVIEVNSNPSFDMHEYPYHGQPFPIGEHIMKAMFK